MRTAFRLILLPLMAVCLSLANTVRGNDAPPAPPPEKCQITGFYYEGEKPAPGVTFNLALRFRLAEGYHVYQEQARFELQEPRWQAGEFVPPPGKKAFDANTNKDVVFLEKDVALKLKIQVPADAGDFANITLRFQVSFIGCTEQACDLDPTIFSPAVKVSELKPFEDLPAVASPTNTPPPLASPDNVQSAPALIGAEEQSGAGDGAGAFDFAALFANAGIWMALLLAFLAGILIAFTPCVFPMISVTMAVLASGAQKSKMRTLVKSLVYVFGISLTYGILGVLLSLPGSQWKNELQYNPYIFPVAGLIFAALALSMFGLYEIRLPMLSAGKFRGEGYGRALLLGAIAGLVATPCVAAPLAALLVYVATQGNPLYGFAIMTAFAWGMGLILIIAGNFVSLMPGEWMDSVKRFFGWALLAVALWLWQEQLGRYFQPALGLFLLTAGVFAGALDQLLPTDGWRPRLARLFGILLMILGVVYLFGSSTAEVGKVKFASVKSSAEFKQKLDLAAQLGRPVFFYAHRNNCSSCKEFEDRILIDRRVIALSEKFLCVEGNFSYFPTGDRGNEIREAYSFQTVPTILFFRPDKTVSMKIQNKQTRESFLKNMQSALLGK